MTSLSTAKTRISKKFFTQHPYLLEVIQMIEQDKREKLTSVIFNELPPNHWAISDIKPSEYSRYYLVSPNGDIARGQTLVHYSENAFSLALYDYKNGQEVAYLYSGKNTTDSDNQFTVGEGCYFVEQKLERVWIYKVDKTFALSA